MSSLLNNPRLLNALHDLAHAEAEALRRAAIADFWRGSDALLQDAAASAHRAAQRLAYRLQRRAGRIATAANPF
ncbi:hypothetical protein J7U46_16515 [Pelomonas sp. V22]|uniref:hypothetical protein n=1 Tax=Pelomonas sp. V22 TaxID=2822139 RepID=UPI0024A85F56|nr:hypothetical protein [Pelomonas sp. V22]MDI4634665.1 hypothetical protein [Pelomonas sp. V22]